MTGLLLALALAAPTPKSEPSAHVNLKDHVNVKPDENLHSNRYENNNLKSLPRGKQKMAEITFDIGEGVVQLGSSSVTTKPNKVENIKVGKAAAKLHFLHGTGYSSEPDTVIAKYVVKYDDDTKAEIEVAYGIDVVDWWAYPDQAAPTKGKLAWEGENEASKGFEAKLKLYAKTWENPKPDKKIATIDFVAANPEQAAAPFLVAITLEAK